MRALVIDDDSLMLKLLSHQLSDAGVSSVTTSECPVAALTVITEDPGGFDVAILDLNMPRMDGIQVLRELAWTSYEGAIILLSGEDERILSAAEKLARSEKLNILGRLRKPVRPDALRALLERVRGDLRAPADRRMQRERLIGVPELKRAISGSELVSYYQPQVALATGRVIGVEALVRWPHPEEGLILPHRFVPLAEKAALINELSWLMFRRSLHDAMEWLASGVFLRLSLNVTMSDLSVLDFPDRVVELCDEFGFPVDHLVLEVTESQLASDWKTTLDVAARLRLKGISLAVDDFGTGYSSLSQLRDMPFDELKLDRTFVHATSTEDTESLRAIVGPHIEMAHKLGLRVVAEGIEDEHEWSFLRQSGCDVGQGYFMAKPMAPEGLVPWLREWERRAEHLVEN